MSQQFWYNFIFIWLAFMALVTKGSRHLRTEYVCGKPEIRWKKSWALMAFWPIFFTVVFTQIRYDGYLYQAVYYNLPSTFSGLINNFDLSESGNLYAELETLTRCLFGTNFQVWRIVQGLAQSLAIILIFRKYSDDYLFSLFVFAAMGAVQGSMMNAQRQFMAAMVIFASMPYMLEKKYIKAAVVVLIASRIHTSALIMLPLVFVCSGKAWNKKTLLFLAGSVVAMAVFSTVSGSFDAVLEGTEYAGTGSYLSSHGDDGMNPIRALVYAVPTIIAFFGRKRIMAENDPVTNLCVNMSIANLGVSLIAVVTSGIMVGRVPIYINPYNYLILPYLIRHTIKPKNVKLVKSLAVVLYMVFYFIEA